MKDKWFIINLIIFHKNEPASNNIVYHMMYGSWDIRHDRLSFLLFWAIFYPLTFLTTQKIKIYKKRKKILGDIIILHLCSTNDTGRDRQNILLFWAIFCSFTPLTTQKIKILKNLKKHLEKISFYISVPYENHMMYGSWDMKCNKQNFFVILGYFLSFYPPNNPENKNLETMKKEPGGIIILHKCTKNYDHPRQKITEILPLHSGIIVVISNK